MRLLAILIILIWLPFSIPLILLGVMVRLSSASFYYGYKITELFLKNIYKGINSENY